jgi:hypothetical protein
MSDALFESHAGRARVVKSQTRSRITNGTSFLPGVDGRGPYIRRAKDLIHDHLQDLGGPDNASTAERSIIRRAAIVTVELENLERRFVSAGVADPGDLSLYLTASNNLRRLLETVGLRRRPRDITPDALTYAREVGTDEGSP